MSKTIRLNGRDVHIPDSVVTAEKILAAAEINPRKNLIRVAPEGNFLVPKGRPVSFDEGSVFIDAPPRIKG
jgi:hypothetical protein